MAHLALSRKVINCVKIMVLYKVHDEKSVGIIAVMEVYLMEMSELRENF